MFFYSDTVGQAGSDFDRLADLAARGGFPCRAKMHLAKYSKDKFATAVIYPAEYDDEVSRWLLDRDYRTAGAAEGGIAAVEKYYHSSIEVLRRHQLFGKSQWVSRSGTQLLAGVKQALQR